MADKQELKIARPPDFIFKYRRRSRVAPAQEVIKNDGIFDFRGVKYPSLYRASDEFLKANGLQREWFKYPVQFAEGQIYVHTELPELTEAEEKMGGQLSCFQDVPFPYKGHPFPEALFAVNTAKRFTRTLLEAITKETIIVFGIPFFLTPKKYKKRIIERLLNVYVSACRKTMETYILEYDYMNKYGKEIRDFVFRFLSAWGIDTTLSADFAECIASQIDWDNAYWMRLGDAMAETTKEKMLADPRKELLHLALVMKERGTFDPTTAARIEKACKAFSYLLFIPSLRRIFRECMQASTFENFQFDEGDRYHCLLFGDYDYLGLPLDKRIKLYKDFHKEHPPEPNRLQIQT